MSDLELIDAVAHVTGEDAHEIRRRGFVLTDLPL
jgi:xanthine dehydrogenase molybdopterin-binding subunit B